MGKGELLKFRIELFSSVAFPLSVSANISLLFSIRLLSELFRMASWLPPLLVYYSSSKLFLKGTFLANSNHQSQNVQDPFFAMHRRSISLWELDGIKICQLKFFLE